MSTPLATIFGGDVTLEQGSDVTQFGWGDLSVNRNITVLGTSDSTGVVSSGAFIVNGGANIGKSLYVNLDAFVLYGRTNLTETHIDTTNGLVSITGGNKVDISVGDASQFIVTGGNLKLSSLSDTLQLYSGLNSYDAVDIRATNADGGVKILSGQSGKVDIVSGSGGIYGFTSSGNISLTASNGSGDFLVNSSSNSQNLSVILAGSTDSQIKIESSGINDTKTALVLNTSNVAGSIIISNNSTGNGTGSLSQLVGSGGFRMITNTGGAVSITSQAAGTFIEVNSANQDQNLSLLLNGQTDSTLLIQSSGINNTKTALQIQTTNTKGDIVISQPLASLGKVGVFTGMGGFNTTTQTGGSIIMNCYGAESWYTNSTTADNQHLYVSVTGNTNSKVIIKSEGKANDAITLETSNGTGGISINSIGGVYVESNNSNLGVQIATSTSGIPVKIGTVNSTTTIMGNLDVKGVTTTIESKVLTVDDNIIVVNNAPSGTSDGGLAIKRYQYANDIGAGDVVADTPDHSGTVQNGGNTATTFTLDTAANSVDNYYNGWWVKFNSGTGSGQVRRIKSYDGSLKNATLYATSDQSELITPIEGLDFVTIPDTTSTYSLYPCHFVMNIWDESRDEFAFVCSNNNPSEQITPSHYSDLHINDLQANGLYANTINDSLADITTTVSLDDGTTIPVPITSFPNKYGIYQVYIKPLNNTTRAHAIFVIGRINVSSTPGTSNRIMSVKGAQYEQLDIQWRADEYPELYYRPKPIGGSGVTVYKIKIVSL